MHNKKLKLVVALFVICSCQLLGSLFILKYQLHPINNKLRTLRAKASDISSAYVGLVKAADENISQAKSAEPSGYQSGSGSSALPRKRTLLPERAASIVRLMLDPIKVHAFIFDANGELIIDSSSFGHIDDFGIVAAKHNYPDLIQAIDSLWSLTLRRWLYGNPPNYLRNKSPQGSDYQEVTDALTGIGNSTIRLDIHGQVIASAAEPIADSSGVLGVVLLSSRYDEDEEKEWSFLRAQFLMQAIIFAAGVSFVAFLGSHNALDA